MANRIEQEQLTNIGEQPPDSSTTPIGPHKPINPPNEELSDGSLHARYIKESWKRYLEDAFKDSFLRQVATNLAKTFESFNKDNPFSIGFKSSNSDIKKNIVINYKTGNIKKENSERRFADNIDNNIKLLATVSELGLSEDNKVWVKDFTCSQSVKIIQSSLKNCICILSFKNEPTDQRNDEYNQYEKLINTISQIHHNNSAEQKEAIAKMSESEIFNYNYDKIPKDLRELYCTTTDFTKRVREEKNVAEHSEELHNTAAKKIQHLYRKHKHYQTKISEVSKAEQKDTPPVINNDDAQTKTTPDNVIPPHNDTTTTSENQILNSQELNSIEPSNQEPSITQLSDEKILARLAAFDAAFKSPNNLEETTTPKITATLEQRIKDLTKKLQALDYINQEAKDTLHELSQEVEQLDQSQKKLLDPFIATAKEAMLLNRVNNVKKCIYGLCTGKIRSKDAQDVLANYYTLSTENDKKIAELTKTISLPMNKILLEQLAKPIDFDMDLLKTLTICKDLLKIYDQDKKLTSLDTDNKTLLASLPEAIEFFTLIQITEYFKQNGISSTTELNHINESQKDAILTGLFESNKLNNFIEAYLRLDDEKLIKVLSSSI